MSRDVGDELALLRAEISALREAVAELTEEGTMGSALLNVDQAAELLGLTEVAVRRRVERGSLRAVRVGRSLRFRRSDLLGGRGTVGR